MSKRFRFILIVFIVILCGASLYPTIRWYFLLPDSEKQRAASPREEIRNYAFKQAHNDSNVLEKMLQEKEDAILTEIITQEPYNTDGIVALVDSAKERAKEIKKPLKKDATVEQVFSVFKEKREVFSVLVNFYRKMVLKLKKQKARIITLGLDLSGGMSVALQVDKADLEKRLGYAPKQSDIVSAIDRAIVVLQGRIDRFGVSEPKIRRQNEDGILVEIPGDNDRERVNSFIQGKGSMSFRIVHEEATEELLSVQLANPSWVYDPQNPPEFISAGIEIIEYVRRDEFGLDKFERWIAIYKDVNTYGINGEYLEQARVTTDPLNNKPLVAFQLNEEGAERLSKLTGDYINQSMAIVLDDKVRAYATLTRVINDGQAVIEGFSQEKAQDIATILQTAILPVKLLIVNQQVVGPTLGRAIIDAGLRAMIVALVLVVIFMIAYYRGPGIISVLSLAFNLLFLLAILASFNFTVTLTGIAGIILTIGMAVDANVLVYERIKEELWAGKTRRTAIQNGFQKAFLTIIDANITTFIAAFFVSQIASGPVQGFAVTLSAGIVTTLISSLFISRFFFDIATDVFHRQTLAITWRKIR